MLFSSLYFDVRFWRGLESNVACFNDGVNRSSAVTDYQHSRLCRIQCSLYSENTSVFQPECHKTVLLIFWYAAHAYTEGIITLKAYSCKFLDKKSMKCSIF